MGGGVNCPTHPRYPAEDCPACERLIDLAEDRADSRADDVAQDRAERMHERWLDRIGGSA